MVHTEIPYGHEKLMVSVPNCNLAQVLSPNPVSHPPSEEDVVLNALNHPFGCDSFVKEMKMLASAGKRNTVIICDDITRETPAYKVLPLMLDRLNEAGISDHRISLVFALGTHRPMTKDEMVFKVGNTVFERIHMYNSECSDEDKMIHMGSTAGGVPVWVDKRVAEADIRIGIGSIVPHPVVGWSSGAKIIFPGVTGEKTVSAFHLNYGKFSKNLFGADTTPVREDIEKWVELVGLHFMFELIITPDAKIYAATAGDFIKAQREGIKHARDVYGVALKEQADITIVSSFPADIDLWQATKAICAADHATRPGGSIILVTPCNEGVGPHKELTAYIGCEEPDILLQKALEGLTVEPVAVSGGVTVARIGKSKRLGIISQGISKKDAEIMGWKKYTGVEEAIQYNISQYGPESKICIITHGGITCPYLL